MQPVQKFAGWCEGPPIRYVADAPAIEAALMRRSSEALGRALAEAWAEPLRPFDFRMADDMMHDRVICIAETRALVLRNPNPFPCFDLFPRWSRLRRLLGGRA